MSAEDLYALTPVQADPNILGVGPAPMAPPPMPMLQGPQGPSKGQQILKLAAMASMLAGGPSMTGLGAGLLQGERRSEEERRRRELESRQLLALEQEQQQDFQRQQQVYQQSLNQRQQTLMNAVNSIRQQVSSVKNKDAYDQQLEGFANLLRSSGFRVDANWLRQAAPFVAPNAQLAANEALERILKNPTVEQQWKDDPQGFANAVFPFDRDGDGQPENITGRDLAVLAGRPFGQNPITGAPEFPEKPTTLATKANADGILQSLVEQAKAEGKRMTPSLMATLQQKAIRMADQAKEKPAGTGSGRKQWITRGGEVIRVGEDEIQPGDVPYTPSQNPDRDPTQGQSQAAGYGARVQQSTSILDQLEQPIAGMRTVVFKSQEYLPPAGQTATYQSYDQAARNFINAVLRRESGAAISPMEFDNARRQYLPMPGDTPATLAQKRQNRAQILASLRNEAGRAWRDPVATEDPAARAKKKLAARPLPSHGGQ